MYFRKWIVTNAITIYMTWEIVFSCVWCLLTKHITAGNYQLMALQYLITINHLHHLSSSNESFSSVGKMTLVKYPVYFSHYVHADLTLTLTLVQLYTFKTWSHNESRYSVRPSKLGSCSTSLVCRVMCGLCKLCHLYENRRRTNPSVLHSNTYSKLVPPLHDDELTLLYVVDTV